MISNLLLIRMGKINFIAFICLFTFLYSCNSDTFEEHELGGNLIDNSTEVLLIDTFTVHSSTVKLDSVKTSGFENVLFGKYKDEFFGEVSSDLYGVVGLGGAFSLETTTISGNSVKIPVKFDSLVFISYTDSRYYGDTLAGQTMFVHELLERTELPDEKDAFYGHDSFAYDSEALEEGTFFLKPVKQAVFDSEKDNDPEFTDGGIRFRMDSDKALALGKDIIQKVNNEDDSVLLANRWQDYFEGIVLKPGDGNTAMFGLTLGNTKMKMRLYYSNTDYEDVGTAKFHDFPVLLSSTDGLSFMNYESDKSSTPQDLGRIVKREEDLSSEKTDDLAFIQGGIGFLTKLRIPYIENLHSLGVTGGVLKAELVFYPKDGSYDDDKFMLPTTPFNVYTTDDQNQILQVLANPINNSALTSIFNINPDNKDESFYSVEITSYVNSLLQQGQSFEDALLISLPFTELGNSFERLVIENDKDSEFRIRLKVTYVVRR